MHVLSLFILCADGVGSLPESTGTLHSAKRAGKSKRAKSDVNCGFSLPAVTNRAHQPFREVIIYHYLIQKVVFIFFTGHLIIDVSVI